MAGSKVKGFWQNGQLLSDFPDSAGTVDIDELMTNALGPIEAFSSIVFSHNDKVADLEGSKVAAVLDVLVNSAEKRIREHLESIEAHTGRRLYPIRAYHPDGKVVAVQEVER